MPHSTVSRRGFLQVASAAGAGALLAGCTPPDAGEAPVAAESPPAWVKDPSPFIQAGTNLETRLEQLHDLITPNDRFYVRNHSATPRVDAATWRLRVEGDGVDRPVELGYEDLLRLPTATTIAYLECAGNWRGLFPAVFGRAAAGGQWKTGAVGCASWSGVPLASVLEHAGLRSDAVDVNLVGLDDGEFNRPMPVGKALDGSTLLATSMNGSDLPPDHGYPVRAVVPGWAGSNSVKWLGRIVVSRARIWVKNNTSSYVLTGDAYPAERYAPAEGAPVTELNVKSALALPWPAALPSGTHRIRGFAYSPHGRIRQVTWRADDGPWRPARLVEPAPDRAWARFEFEWEAAAGSRTLTVRASDARGNTQPESMPWNDKGYLLNVPVPHPVTVS